MMMKRLFDVLTAALLFFVCLPFMFLMALAIKVLMPGPVFYCGIRIGLHGVPFRMWKFRSMIVDAEKIGGSSTPGDDPRMTMLGSWMRRYKVDELPQLWNVLIGDMSLVGPRPQVAWAVERYTQQERVLLTVRPGLTDPASLRFANEGEILRGHPDPDRGYLELIHPEKMRLSLNYVKARSFVGDLRILVATVSAALGRRRDVKDLPEQGTSLT
jgi:lipopolysaccharide/colanic/teichoic acid biosynthesis glycosyltransferase